MTGTPLKVLPSPRAPDYLFIVGLALSGALALHRPELVALAVPFVGALIYGLLLQRRPVIALRATLTAERVVEGDAVELVVRLASTRAVSRADVYLAEPLTAPLTGPDARRTVVRLLAGTEVELRFSVRTDHWGVFAYTPVDVVVSGPLGLVNYQQTWDPDAVLRVLPGPERLRELARPRDTSMTAGNRIAATRGEGFDFADIRAFRTGDRPRNVNWRASARTGELRVNQRHPERSTDVVLMLDGSSNEGLTGVVRATAALANAYLAERDRVGLVRFGSALTWLRPGMGDRQLLRIVDTAIDTSALFIRDRKGVRSLPYLALPPRALVIAITSLPDSWTTSAILDVAFSGAQLAVVEVIAPSLSSPGPRASDQLAFAMWQLEQDLARERLRDRAIPVVSWTEAEPLAAVLEEVATFQRYARHRFG